MSGSGSAGLPAKSSSSALRGLIMDWGGVLTRSVGQAWRSWAAEASLDVDHFDEVLRHILFAPVDDNLVHAVERGEITEGEFERKLAARLRRLDGGPVPPDGLLAQLWRTLAQAPDMIAVVRRARQIGLRTALLSNAWGDGYDRTLWPELFDVIVISSEVKLRKPEPEIYLLTARRLGVSPGECVFVDDLAHNVQGAVAVGMVGIHHVDPAKTVAELNVLFGANLATG